MATRLCALALAAATIATLTWATVALESLHQQLHGQGPPLLRYSVRPVGRVNSSYGVAQGYWHLEVNHSFPEPGLVAKARLRKGIGGAGNRSCWEVAQGHAEPYTDFYAPRGSPVQEEEAEMIEEMMLAALHLFKVPDADVLVHLGDGAPEGLPLLQANIDRGVEDAGFAIPKRMWADALGPEQLNVLHECLEVRYPRATAARAPRAAWRGTNTDRRIDPMDESNALDALRSRLHLMGRWYPDIFDAHYTDFGQRAFDTQASNLTGFYEHLLAPGHTVEHFSNSLHDLPQHQGVAALALNQVALPEAMAAAITKAAELSDWQVEMQPGYEEVPFSRCCTRSRGLPAGFVEALRATQPGRGGGGGGAVGGGGGAGVGSGGGGSGIVGGDVGVGDDGVAVAAA
ncbi:hypothetical protein MNEG_6255 [Monoraphidium neglectum]|uniref:Uncharacterized protein n=1 Tax=Monoraphidium neglectum TaxID=145388 RepID=A0A0D2MMD8_9CHLO|nr:hypothetical protein MNEG_6255 [Monoraphidium neglectum]KIZ01707.1 hypothetical protein MNEG_6255 [Monoraphidium neglectum]|eukprot:XP_013900726.1 hypothetical protein MNEG_6255 [Monoraphidium neglectum]